MGLRRGGRADLRRGGRPGATKQRVQIDMKLVPGNQGTLVLRLHHARVEAGASCIIATGTWKVVRGAATS